MTSKEKHFEAMPPQGTQTQTQTQTTDSSVSLCSSTSAKPELGRQNSAKRRTCKNDEQDESNETASKKGRLTTNNLVVCPLNFFGCIAEVPSDELAEHYRTECHQKAVLLACKQYTQQIHNNPCAMCNESDHYEKNAEEMSSIFNAMDIISGGVNCLHEDNVQIHTQMIQIQHSITQQVQRLENLKKSLEEQLPAMTAMNINYDVLQTEFDILKQATTDFMPVSYDGTYIWKITNVAEKISNAMSERQTSIYSAPFFSSPTGYKMCMRLYLHGDGQARRTHMSLFFVLMRGEYDAIITWPFNFKITFTLYDQTEAQRHIVDSFRPDVKSNSFQRPRSKMNIASGIPKFLPLTVIQQEDNAYIRDDCMFIRCMVDFESAPKTIIPYAVSLNPALPNQIQRDMIKAEIERRHLLTTEKSSPTGAPEASTNCA